MFYYLYEVRNNINNKIYVGVHKTEKLNDGYMGSGKIIRDAIKKYGIQNFTKTILETFSSSDEMYNREKEIVTEEFLMRDDVYNLRRGGFGGFEFINENNLGKKFSGEYAKWCRAKSSGSKGKVPTKETLEKRINTRREKNNWKYDQLNSPESIAKKKNTFAEIGHQQGEKHSQYGTMWITNGSSNKKIKKTDIIPDGWNKGRNALLVK